MSAVMTFKWLKNSYRGQKAEDEKVFNANKTLS